MTVLAFTYDDYYCYGMKNSFRGQFDDDKEAREMLQGERYSSKNNLETIDTETFAFKKWIWRPLYIVRKKDGEEYLEYRWPRLEKPDVELIKQSIGNHDWSYEYRREENPLYYAGEWVAEDTEIEE